MDNQMDLMDEIDAFEEKYKPQLIFSRNDIRIYLDDNQCGAFLFAERIVSGKEEDVFFAKRKRIDDIDGFYEDLAVKYYVDNFSNEDPFAKKWADEIRKAEGLVKKSQNNLKNLLHDMNKESW